MNEERKILTTPDKITRGQCLNLSMQKILGENGNPFFECEDGDSLLLKTAKKIEREVKDWLRYEK